MAVCVRVLLMCSVLVAMQVPGGSDVPAGSQAASTASVPLPAVANEPAAASLARPSAAQYAWHEQERIMFVCIGVATWEGSEYDADGKTDLTKMNPAGFDAEAICKAAESWGAREILLVASHVGGFCLWPTETTDYSVKHIPWKDGKGDMVREVADACRRHGLSIGIYLYPDNVSYTKQFGHGGRTDDPAKQEEWTRKFRKQWEETLSRCGPDLVREVWLDGGCIIELGDILRKLAPEAVVFQGRNASIRWVGNEAGIAGDPNWNSLSRADLASGGATQSHSTPQGDAWAPTECDTTLYDHFWFWAPAKEVRRKSLDHLLRTYIQSAGRGSVLLLNATPNTSGRIPEGDLVCYREFGEALTRNFGHPLATASSVTGSVAELDLGAPTRVSCSDLWEDYRLGHRIRSYVVEGRVRDAWTTLATGTAVGRRKLDLFAPVVADRVRVRVTESVGTPVIRLFQVHQVDDALLADTCRAVSQGRPAKASSFHSEPYKPCFLVDGKTDTRWGVKDNDPDPWVEIDLGRPLGFAAATASELADRVKRFQVEYRNDEQAPWKCAYAGTTIGSHWTATFPRIVARFVRLHILEYTGPGPTLWEFQVQDRPGAFGEAGTWQAGAPVAADLSAAVTEAAQYEVRFVADDGTAATVQEATLLFEGVPAEARFLSGVGTDTLRINRTQAVGDGASTAVRAVLKAPEGVRGKILIRLDRAL